MRNRTWRVIADTVQGVAGGPLYTYHSIVGLHTRYDTTPTEEITNIPLPLNVSRQQEGIDFPFFRRDDAHGEMQTLAIYHKLRAFSQVQNGVSNDYEQTGIALPLILNPLEGFHIAHRSQLGTLSDEQAIRTRKAQRDAQTYAAIQAQEGLVHINPAVLAATQYIPTVCGLLEEIQYHMLEPTIDLGLTWTLWTQAEVLGHLNNRIADFAQKTGLLLKRLDETSEINKAKYDLPSDCLQLRRLTWNGVVLPKVDKYMMDHGEVGWHDDTAADATEYIIDPNKGNTIELHPKPTAVGTLGWLYEYSPTDVAATCGKMPFPKLFTIYIKYGVMADMFRAEGEANDPQRAKYCEQRYTEGISMGKALLGIKS